jgi:predicted GNAT family N-acyltransferase
VIVEGDELTTEQWDELRAGEKHPFGVDGLQWRKREHFLALRVSGRLVSTASWAIVDVEAGGEAFPVVGLGAVLVSRPDRGTGYARRILEAWLERAAALGPARATLFCAPHHVGLYERVGFVRLQEPVTADQRSGTVTMPGAFMWRPLHAGVTWPEGPIRVRGLPF